MSRQEAYCGLQCGTKRNCELILILLTWTIWGAPTNASKWRMGFNSAFKGLKLRCNASAFKDHGLSCVEAHCWKFSQYDTASLIPAAKR
jgi:hypothetical protein